jgi:hypothetical protein
MFTNHLSLEPRLQQRAGIILDSMSKKTTAIIQQFASSRSEIQGACRFFNNAAVRPEMSLRALSEECRLVVKDKRVLLIEDTSSIQRKHLSGLHADNDPDLGRTEGKDLLGFFVHPVLAVEASTGLPLGIAGGRVWSRLPMDPAEAKDAYKKKPLHKKESSRWVECAREALDVTREAAHRVVIGDREADMYDLYALASEASVSTSVMGGRTDVLLRARADRNGQTDEGVQSIFEQVAASSVLLHTHCETRTKSGKRREVVCEVRSAKVEICRPKRADKTLPPTLCCWIIEAKEIPPMEGLPEGEEPVLWRIITTLPICTAEEADQALRWYCRRWQIEQLFRLLKSEGLRVEDSQLERGIALQNMVVFALAVALKLLQATTVRDLPNTIAPEFLFSPDEQACAEALIPRYEGKTEAQKNPHPPKTLLRYIWLIARLGGWKGYQRESPPGPITMRRGFERFSPMLDVWAIFKEHSP